MAAPPPDPLFSAVCADGAYWTAPHPNYCDTMTHIGPASTTSRPAALRNVHDLALRYPVAAAYVPDDDPDLICIGHTFTVFPSEPTNPANIDNLGCVLVGNHRDAAQPICFPDSAFQRSSETNCLRHTQIRAHQNGTPAELRQGPHPDGTTDVDKIRHRPALLLPFRDAHEFLSTNPTGVCSLAEFFTRLVEPKLASTDPNVVAECEIVRDWWRGAATKKSGSNSSIMASCARAHGVSGAKGGGGIVNCLVPPKHTRT